MVMRSPFWDAHAAQGGGDALDFVLELGVGEDLALAALVGVDKGCVSAPAAIDMVVDAVVGEVGLGAAEPLECGGLPNRRLRPTCGTRGGRRRRAPRRLRGRRRLGVASCLRWG